MKICAFQPPYPHKPEETNVHFRFLIDNLENCDDSIDLIVLPECCNAPSSYPSTEMFLHYVESNTLVLLEKAKETAQRCHSIVSVNLYEEHERGYRNTTIFYGTDGEIKGRYFKQHLPVTEACHSYIDNSYAYDYVPPYVVEYEGVRYGFLTCYDCYFEEYIAHLATKKVDVILVSSHQRSERFDMLEAQVKNIAFNCNAFVVRSSVSMGDEGFPLGGHTMIVSPDGTILSNQKQKVGVLIAQIDPLYKHVRPEGFGNKCTRNDFFITRGRMPWSYRVCGASVRPNHQQLSYPRVCAYRGFSTLMPENTMPAFATAVSLGVDELEIDVWCTKDQRFLVCHDSRIDRTSNGHGEIAQMLWSEIKTYAITGVDDPLKQLRFSLLDDILKRFARQVVFNIHLKTLPNELEYSAENMRGLVSLLEYYDCTEHVYISGTEAVLRTAILVAPQFPRCVCEDIPNILLIELAKRYECDSARFYLPDFQKNEIEEVIKEGHASGIRISLYTDDPQECEYYLHCGVDTILTRQCLHIVRVIHGNNDSL